MRVGLIGDLHGEVEWVKRQIRLSSPDFCIQVGDYWAYNTTWDVPVYWCLGNHEESSAVKLLQKNIFAPLHKVWFWDKNSFWQKGGEKVEIEGVSIVFLPGKVREDPSPGPAGFEYEIWEQCMHIKGGVDIVVSHGCAFPFQVNLFGKIIQCEEEGITQVVRHLSPKIAISGHNHEQFVEDKEGILLYRMGIANVKGSGYKVIEV
jgi:predicted phosphodiesterase